MSRVGLDLMGWEKFVFFFSAAEQLGERTETQINTVGFQRGRAFLWSEPRKRLEIYN